jgi:hypothetical protein
MSKPNILGIFCEDIRDEASGLLSFVGVMQDNLSVPVEKGMIPKLCVYIRISFAPHDPPRPMKFHLAFPDGERVFIGEVAQDIINKAGMETKEQDGPIATIVSRAALSGLGFSLGRFTVSADTDDGEVIPLVSLKFVLDQKASIAPIASQPLS